MKQSLTYPLAIHVLPKPTSLHHTCQQAFFKSKHESFAIYKIRGPITETIPPPHAFGDYRHTVLLITEGKIKVRIGHYSLEVSKNQVLMLPLGKLVTLVDVTASAKGYLCQFREDFLMNHFSNQELFTKDLLFIALQPSDNVLTLPVKEVDYLGVLLKKLDQEYNQSAPIDWNMIRPCLLIVLFELNRLYSTRESVGKSTAKDMLMRKFKALVLQHFRAIHSVAAYADLLHITPNHLYKTIKQATGISPSQWITMSIISEAKALLVQSDLSINQIAEKVGLSDPSYFSRLFRKQEGISPCSFRKVNAR